MVARSGAALVLTGIMLLPALSSAPAAQAPEPMAPPGFSVKVEGFATPLPITPLFAMPGQSIEVEVIPFGHPEEGYVFHVEKGSLRRIDAHRWEWTAPREPGFAVLRIEDSAGRALRIHAFVKVPATEVRAGWLNGYRIGTYPPETQNARYAPPEGFIEVTEALASVPISPHFRLEQFLCKQTSGWPKYLVLDERLVLKLEKILEELNLADYGLETFHVMSGYRTPYYNKAIGNVAYSRHQYGDAADIFIDREGDGWMDDLDGDGKATLADARHIAEFIEKRSTAAWYAPFVGGLGVYGPRRHRGPFIHVDTRAHKARWESP